MVTSNILLNKLAEANQRTKATSNSIIRIECGDSYNLLLSEDGMLYAFGVNSHGQLGFEEVSSFCPRPVIVKFPSILRVSEMSCGDLHSLDLINGSVYAWGSNLHGQLGLGNIRSNLISSPELIKSLQGTYISQITCGSFHSAAIEKFDEKIQFQNDSLCSFQQGRLFMWGQGKQV